MTPWHKKVGIIGAGQLGKLMAIEGLKLGLSFQFWADPKTAITHELGPCWDPSIEDLGHFCEQNDVISIEYEHMPDSEISIFEQFAPYQGKATLLRIAQDRLLEKKLLSEHIINCAPFCPVDSFDDLQTAIEKLGLPLVLKQRKHGYDGKGQYVIRDRCDLEALPTQVSNLIAESFIPFEFECSLVCVRSAQGEFETYDLCQNTHVQGILSSTINRPDAPEYDEAKRICQQIGDACDYVGVFAVEFFSYQGKLMVNEISPRVHNTGHWTLDACDCSQFENHLRAILGLELGSTKSFRRIKMDNIIGDPSHFNDYLSDPSANLYYYGKSARKGRKLGHVTLAYPTSS